MKKILKGAVVFLLIFAIAGCSQKEMKNITENAENLSDEDIEKIEKEFSKNALDKISYKWTELLLNENEENKNFVISPVGINRSLKILLSNISDKNKIMDLYEKNTDLDKKYKNTNSDSVVLVNKNLGLELTDEAKSDSKIKLLEFPKEATNEKINLQKRILEEVMNEDELSKDLALTIMDATRFKIKWADGYKFSEQMTKEENFTTADNETKMPETMNKFFEDYAFVDEDAEVVRLLGDDASVYFIRPKKNPKEFVNRLEEYVKKYDEKSEKYSIELHLPKVEFRSNIEDIQKGLKYFAMDSLNSGFYLDKIIKNSKEKAPLAISEFVQNAYLKIDEKGAEAKAFTEIEAKMMSMPADPPKELVLKYNTPYYIVIKDKIQNEESEDIVFTAYVADPTEK